MLLRASRLLLVTALVSSAGSLGCTLEDGDADGRSASKISPPPATTNGATTPAGNTPPVTDAPGTNPDGTPAEGEPEPVPGVLSASYVDYAINHVLSTGQSNSVSNGGTPVLTTTQPFSNLMFDTGVMPMSSCDGDGCFGFQTPQGFSPLVEGDRFFDYPVETASSGLANEVSSIAAQRYEFGSNAKHPAKHNVLVSLHGRSGNTYWCLRKGGCSYHPDAMVKPFTQAMMEVQAAKQLADAAGLSYAVRAVTAVHGESDHYSYTSGSQEFPLPGSDGTPGKIKDYADALEWQHDYETDATAITGQKVGVPMFISQLSGWNDTRVSKLAQMQLDAHIRAPGKVILVAPGYAISVREDCLHYDSNGQRQLGEYLAKAYAKTVFSGKAWEPLRPKTIARNGNVITVKYLVPKAPLVIDTQRVSDPGNYGFDLVDDSGATPAITGVSVSGPDTVTITLASAPTGAVKHLRYAQNQTIGSCIGPGTLYNGGARGNLHDSDDTPSNYGYDLSNWSVAFDMAVP